MAEYKYKRSTSTKTNKSYLLRAIPVDVYDAIIKMQEEKRNKCGCNFSMESTIYMMIRQHLKTE